VTRAKEEEEEEEEEGKGGRRADVRFEKWNDTLGAAEGGRVAG
jgi:hypothetical protein